MDLNNNIYDVLSKKYNIKLYFVTSGDQFCLADGEDAYINQSYIAGDEIWIGIYLDEELKLISFFHELGHFIDPTNWSINADSTTTYKAEVNAWKLGLELAKKYNIFFSDKAKQWANKQCESYLNYDQRRS